MVKKTNKYLIYNDKVLEIDQPVFTSKNRSFRYGDGLFESIRFMNGSLPLFDDHFERLINGLKYLKIQGQENWSLDFFKTKIHQLLEKNGIKENGRVRFSIFRTDGGLYSPRSLKGDYLIEAENLNYDGFPINKKGLKVDIFADMEKACNILSNYKTNSALVYVLASIYKKEENLDDCLLLNSKNRVAECINSNLFLVKNGEILTPPLTEGCVAGVMRKHLLHLMDQQGIKYKETPILLEDIFQGEELFLSDATKGIRWVASYKVKRFELNVAKQLSDILNQE